MDKRTLDEAKKRENASGIFADLVDSIALQESGKRKNTSHLVSNAGAVGGMQMLKSTFDSVADKGWDINNPIDNARAGIRYLAQMHKVSGGDPTLTAVGYYGGPGAIAKAKKGIAVSDPRNPKAPNTLEYGQQVVSRMGGMPNMKPVANQATNVVAPMPAPMQTGQMQAPMEPVGESTFYRDQVAAQEPVQAPMTEEEAWLAFQKTLPQQEAQVVQQPQFNYGNSEGVVIPNFAGAVAKVGTVPNFSAFKTWGRQRG